MKRTRKTDGGDKVHVVFTKVKDLKLCFQLLLLKHYFQLLQKDTKSSSVTHDNEKQAEGSKGKQSILRPLAFNQHEQLKTVDVFILIGDAF